MRLRPPVPLKSRANEAIARAIAREIGVDEVLVELVAQVKLVALKSLVSH